MIKAYISDTAVRVDGHAPREPGAKENLVCAAASTLVRLMSDALPAYAGTPVEDYQDRKGHISYSFQADSPGSMMLLKTLEMGLCKLGESHPGTIEVCSAI